jgi:hypothetical protein
MRKLAVLLLYCLLSALSSMAFASEPVSVGGDTYLQGGNAEVNFVSARDVFSVGMNVTLAAQVEQDAHLAGFNVNSNGPCRRE